MSAFINSVVNDGFIWDAIQNNLSGKVRNSNTRYRNFNCPMCIHRGETADRKQRCGAKRTPEGVRVDCFNCGLHCGYKMGELLSKNMRAFLEALGVGETEVKRLNLKAMQYRRIIESSPAAQALVPISYMPSFPAVSLPTGAKSLEDWLEEGCDDPDFIQAAEYAHDRGSAVWNATRFYWTPDTAHQMNKRVILPFLFQGAIVGWAARATDAAVSPRYWSSAPGDFLFNNHFLTRQGRTSIIVVEGVIDALAIEGVSTLGAKLSDRQAMWLNGQGKRVVVVADRDSSGTRLIDAALKHNWAVSFPQKKGGTTSATHGNWWEPHIKDTADAVAKYGRLYVLKSIMATATTNKIEIRSKSKWLV